MLVLNGYLFVQKSSNALKTIKYYQCIRNTCNARARTLNNICDRLFRSHNHQPDSSELKYRQQKQEIFDAIEANPSRPAPEIYEKVTNSLLSSVRGDEQRELASALKPLVYMESSIYRKKLKNLPTLPTTMHDLQVPELFKNIDQERFLLFDSSDDERILIFGTEDMVSRMCKANTLYMDGTFYSAPSLFSQLYTVHFMVSNVAVCGVYCLLPDKTFSTYIRMLRAIQDIAMQLGSIFNPQYFVIDFEQAMISACNALFPSSRVRGCLFHFGQCIWRNVQKLGLQKSYDDRPIVRTTVKRLIAMPFVDPLHLDDAMEWIFNETEDDEECEKIIHYFWRAFFAPNAYFKRDIWSHFDNFGPRTTNNVEGWHMALNRRIGIAHPNIWKFIAALQDQTRNFKSKVLMAESGQKVLKKGKSMKDLKLK